MGFEGGHRVPPRFNHPNTIGNHAPFEHLNPVKQDVLLVYAICGGGLFRWVDHGYQTEKAHQAGWSAAEKKEEAAIRVHRWEEGNKLFSTLEELRGMHRSALPGDNVP